MKENNKLFIDYNSFDENWKVLNKKGQIFGSGETPEDAIASARVVTNKPIYSNSNFKGIISGKPVIPVINSDELAEDCELYGTEELIETMADLGGFHITKVQDSTGHFFLGYKMEALE